MTGDETVSVLEPDFVALWFPVAWMLLVCAAGVVSGLKGRWGWLLAGLLVGGLLWVISAGLPARPGSSWARRHDRRLRDPGRVVNSETRMTRRR